MKESQLQDLIRLAISEANPAVILWRNNIGVAELHGHKIRFGVGGPGAADLLGIYKGRFLAVEIKTPVGRQTPDQRMFQQLVENNNGVYVILRSVDDAKAWATSVLG